MRRRQRNPGVIGEYARPFVAGLFEQLLDLRLEFDITLAGIAEFKIVGLVRRPDLFIIQFSEDELEDFLKHVNARIGKHFVLHFENEVFQRLARLRELVNLEQVIHRKRRIEDVRQRFRIARDVGDVLEEIGVLALMVRDGLAIGPYGHARARRMSVAFELFAPVLGFRLLDLDDDIGNVQIVLVTHDNVGAFRFASEIDRELEC